MTIYLGLGSNEGDRRSYLELAITRLVAYGFRLDRVSPIVESPAMLPTNAKSTWNKPFLNVVISGDAHWSPLEGLKIAKQIELELGRKQGPKWSPRPIDIDLLLWHQEEIDTDVLTIPHPGIAGRDFVLTPLMHLQPDLVIPDKAAVNQKSVFALSRGRKNIPLWMGIVNLTPDSFSDGGSWSEQGHLTAYLDKLIDNNVQIIDIGAESTRPNAESIDDRDEWGRLGPVLDLINERLRGKLVRPLISLDSRHPKVMEKGFAAGIDIVNDVTGLDNPEMAALVRDCDCQVVAMHAMSVPVDPALKLPDDQSATQQILNWAEDRAEQWAGMGIDLNRMIIDPGIGFGKSSIQAYELMSHCDALRSVGMRLLIGHSRKSFLSGITDRPPGQRDLETLGISMGLCQQGVDIIRVHQPFIHQRAYRAWSHIALD